MKTILRNISAALMILIILSACAPTAGANPADLQPGPAAWIDAPLDNSTLPQAAYQVVSHADDSAGIAAFELSVNGQVLSTDPVPGDQAGKKIAHISQPWLPPAPGTYLIEVRAKNKGGAFGPKAAANVTVGRVQAATPTLAVLPSTTPSPSPTASVALATGLKDTNCRNGPGSKYDVGGTLAKDQAVQIDGINAERTWVQVLHPNFEGRHCWLSIPFIKIDGSLDGLPVIPAPPAPDDSSAPEPTATIDHH